MMEFERRLMIERLHRQSVDRQRDRSKATRAERRIRREKRNIAIVAGASAILAVGICSSMVNSIGYEQKPVVEPVNAVPVVYVEPVAVDPLEAEKIAIAKTVWGEARGCDTIGQENVVWTILARYDDGRFGDSILEVITAPRQFDGYNPDYPVDAEIMAVVENVVGRWLDGDPGPGYLYFRGDGRENRFTFEEVR